MNAPLAYLDAAGDRARIILPLTWFTLAVAVAVCIAIALCLWLALRRARVAELRSVAVEQGASGLRWISWGLAASALPLLAILLWTLFALAAMAMPARDAPLTLDITAHQWWWEVHYDAQQPAQAFSSANEIHIPVGQRVQVRLHGGDVIHSFWVPKLSGKTDAIPGQTNLTWMQAETPGRYAGECSEYCGLQHAHMALQVVAETPAEFAAWRAAQLQPAAMPTTPSTQRGQALLEYRCGLCHSVRGTTAGAVVAPDLTHVASRATIAAGMLPNDAASLASWIEHAQRLKPGTLMPDQQLDSTQLADVVAYLGTLR